MIAARRQLVVPGDALAEGAYRVGENAYREGSIIYAAKIGLAEVEGSRVSVVPLRGFYMPKADDVVIGRLVDMTLAGWLADIGSPYRAFLPFSDVKGRRAFTSHAGRGLELGDLVIARVVAFDRTRDPVLTVRGRGLGKVTAGKVVEISPTRIPRLIGRRGSMINMLKRELGCDVLVGQNGVILISAKTPEVERAAEKAMLMIEREAHTKGLTDRIREIIRREMEAIAVGQR